MKRRTLLQLAAFAAAARRAPAQTAKLRELAVIVLPASVGADGIEKVVSQFERYIREYRPGAETDHGYGNTRIRFKGPALAPAYAKQLDALPSPLQRSDVEAALTGIAQLPRLPDASSVIAGLMSFYFFSSDANDLCYHAAIERDRCRGLDGSSAPPPPLKGATA